VSTVLSGALSTALSSARSSLLAAMDLALPAECAGCGLLPGLLCRNCGSALAAPAQPAWPRPSPAGLPPPWAVAGYDGSVRAALLAHKEQGRAALARPLGGALACSVRAALASTEAGAPRDPLPTGRAPRVVLVPMPSRRSAVRERGRDPTLAIARRASRLLRGEGGDASVRPVLRLAGTVQDQSGLDAQARAANLRDAVLLPDRWVAQLSHDGTRVVLVDDIITTGASLAAAAVTLRRAGIEVVGAALVAATRRRTPESVYRRLQRGF
jgi:predicted amidophosphoribosyltransferase